MIRLLAVVLLFSMAACSNGSENKEQEGDLRGDSVATPADNKLTDAEKAAGWQLLFNGSDKSGWHIYNNKGSGADWTVEDGALQLTPSGMEGSPAGGDLLTDSSYSNFDLQVDWKIDTAGNSGILFYVKEDPQHEHSYFSGPEMQVLDNERHPDAKIIKHRAGDLYDLISCSQETVKPALEWNHVEIVSNNGHLEFYLNGTKVVDTMMWDDNWKKMIAGSKFREWPDFGTYKEGRIALQDHGNKVWYKNIKIKRL